MALFKDLKEATTNIFLNPIALDFDYQPKLIKYREQNQFFIANCIKPLLQNRNAKNVFTYGPPGIGKTVSIKHVTNELQESTDDIYCIYINCWKKDTAYKIALGICEQIGYTLTQNKNTDELLKKITELINKRSAVIVLDEIDRLKEIDILYHLVEDLYKKCLILITNQKEWLFKLDQRLKSRLTPELLEYKPYNEEETLGILKQRIEYAFHPNTIEQDALKIITEKTFALKDIRTGLFLLKEAGELAETNFSKKITKDFALKSSEKLKEFTITNEVELEQDQQLILDIIKQNSSKTATEIYDIFRNDTQKDMSYRNFFRKLKALEEARQIKITEVNEGIRGKHSIVEFGVLKKLDEFS